MAGLSITEIHQIIRAYFQSSLNHAYEVFQDLRYNYGFDIQREISSIQSDEKAFRQMALSRQYSPEIVAEASRLLQEGNPSSNSISPDELEIARDALVRARIQTYRYLAASLSGKYAELVPDDPIFAGIEPTGLPGMPISPIAAAQPLARLRSGIRHFCHLDLRSGCLWRMQQAPAKGYRDRLARFSNTPITRLDARALAYRGSNAK